MQDLDYIKQYAINNLEELSQQIRMIQLLDKKIITFDIQNIASENIKIIDEIKKWEKSNGEKYIYIFELSSEINSEQVHRNFKSAKDNNFKERAYARINGNLSKILYVGSTTKSKFHSRVKQHLGFGTKRTFALHIDFWRENLKGKINLICLKFDKTTNDKLIQTIEDSYWSKNLPMFGRQGSK
jgi:hypothetical protein